MNPPTNSGAVEVAPGVHWIGVLDPGLRSFDIILKTANGTTYNAYAVRGSEGVVIIDTVKACYANEFSRRLESVADYDEIRVIVLNHLEPDHSGALPELLRRVPPARLYISMRGKPMFKGLLNGDSLEFTPVGTGDSVSLGDRRLCFLPTLNGDAVKPVWDLLSSLTAIKVRGKLGGAFGSFGWRGEALQMIEDRLRELKFRRPVKGVRARLIPTAVELEACRALGHELGLHLTGQVGNRIIDMAALA